MEKTKEGKFKVTTEKNFTGTLIVYRQDANGQIDTSKADIIQYKKGKPVRVSSPQQGTAMIANLEEIKQKAKNSYSYYIRKNINHIKNVPKDLEKMGNVPYNVFKNVQEKWSRNVKPSPSPLKKPPQQNLHVHK